MRQAQTVKLGGEIGQLAEDRSNAETDRQNESQSGNDLDDSTASTIQNAMDVEHVHISDGKDLRAIHAPHRCSCHTSRGRGIE